MKALSLSAILLIVPAFAFCQNSTLPSVYIDSLIFETHQNRFCQDIASGYLKDIENLEAQLNVHGQMVKLLEDKNTAQGLIIYNMPKEIKLMQEQHNQEKKKFKRKIRKLWAVIAGEGAIIAAIVLLL